MFWGADCHTKLWREMFFSNKYNDILVPAAEDTNNRLQDINFSGRIGMWASGYVKDYAMRLIDDNATSWRPLSPGAQRSISPYLRNGALIAAYGGRYGVNFNINYIEKPGFYVLYSLMKSGLIPVVEPKDILSISAWHGIKDIDQTYLEKCNNGHDLEKYSPDDDKNVVGNAGVQWCGAPVSDHDYSKIALGVDYRWLNFLPKTPHGMVPITDVDCFPKLQKAGAETFVSDICHGYIKGKKVSGEDFAKTMKMAVDKGAKKLFMTVDGAAWSLLRIDEKHARLVLVDPGYVDPQERQVTIHFQNKAPLHARNILTKEELVLNGMNAIKVSVPAGSMSFIDFEYDKID